MARIHGTIDEIAAQYAKSCLEQAGFHPYLFCRVQPPGGARFLYSLFKTVGEFDGLVVNEIKIMVPLQEVVPAEKLLDKLRFLTSTATSG
jgi:hypothetical protein